MNISQLIGCIENARPAAGLPSDILKPIKLVVVLSGALSSPVKTERLPGGQRLDKPTGNEGHLPDISGHGSLEVNITIEGVGETRVKAWNLRGNGPTQLREHKGGEVVTRSVFDMVKSALAQAETTDVDERAGQQVEGGDIWIAAATLGQRNDSSEAISPGAPAPHRFVQSALDFIKLNLHRKITMRDAARSAGASIQHFCRVFGQETGQPFMKFVGALRAEKAAELLSQPGKSIKEIAFEAGFGSIAQFNRIFKRHHGVAPKDYRINGGFTETE